MALKILVTGISGFIGKHVALAILNAGHEVRGSVRNLSRGDEVRAALRPHLTDAAALDRLGFVALDLTSDLGWAEAAKGMDVLVHTASPFPIAQPKNADEIIRPAVEGTRRALTAAADAGVRRVVLTSSVIAVMDARQKVVQDESYWCNLDDPAATPYARSKTLAEREAWTIAKARGLDLTAINPGLVFGPPLDAEYGASVGLVKRLLKGRDPMLPPFGFPVVDVRDVALMHLRAIERPETAGKRYIASAGSLEMAEMGRILKAAYPTRRIATKSAPQWLVRLLALADAEIRTIVPKLGTVERASNQLAQTELGVPFIAADQSLRDSAKWLVDHGHAWT